MVFQNQASRSFRVSQDVCKDLFLASLFLFFFINNLPTSLPFSVTCSLYADDLAIWSPSPSVLPAAEATQGALIRMDCFYKLLVSSSQSDQV